MLARLGSTVVRRRRLVLVTAAIAFAFAGVIGGGVAEHLSSGGFEDPDAESTEAARILEDDFGQGIPNLILLVTAEQGTVDDPAVAEAGRRLTEELAAEDGVAQAFSYWSVPGATPLRSGDARRAMVIARIPGTDDEVRDVVEDLSPRYKRDGEVIDVGVGGFSEVFREVGTTIESDLARAEAIALPLTLLLLVIVFGSVVAASLPLAVGALSVIGTFFILRMLASVTEVSIFALNMTTAMGLGLAIDYSLFIVSRYREELRQGFEPHAAVQRTVLTAGRTVAFSALTVAVSLAALLVFPLAFLRSFAYAGIGVALCAAIGAVVVLPAFLAVLGRKVDSWRLWRRPAPSEGTGFWHSAALGVMKRPVPVATAVIVLLLVLGGPFLHITFGLPDDRVLPEEAESREVHDILRTEFASKEAAALSVVAVGTGDPFQRGAEIGTYATELSTIEGVARVDALNGSYVDGQQVAPGGPASLRFIGADGDGTYLSVVPDVEPNSPEGEALVGEIRDTPAPFEVSVAGPSAELRDSKASLFGRVPLAIVIISLVTFTVLFLMFGSIVVPLKALVLNFLSLSATFGAMVWVFQDGHLSGLLDFTPTGTIDTVTPILMFCVAFGLSMDYEVFLLSRIKEEHDRSGDNVASVALGLERTGRIVTAAAVLIAVVFVAFATSGVTFIKLFGLGLTVAVLMDAFLIRATLVPAFMRLAGEANWWAPGPLRRLHERIGFSEHIALEPVSAAPAPETLSTMDALELLTSDHNEVRRLAGEFQQSAEAQRKLQLVRQMAQELELHTTIEEEVFYPAVRKEGGELAKLVEEGVEEHNQVDELLAQLADMTAEDPDFEATANDLIASVEHHAGEEEREWWPKLRQRWDTAKRERLGQELEAAKTGQPMPSDGQRDVDLDLTKAELYEKAKELDIDGRSKMNKEELAEAVRRA
jgi:RND superfamily putative drug exporter